MLVWAYVMQFQEYFVCKCKLLGAVKKFPEFFDIDSLVITSLCRLDWMLQVISTCKTCKGWAMQCGGRGVTCGRDICFCIMTMHRATHPKMCSNPALKKYSCHRPTIVLSICRRSRCSLFRKLALRGQVLQPWRTYNQMRRPNSGRFQKKPSADAYNNGRIDGARVCVCVL
jgi:hypothetical protein